MTTRGVSLVKGHPQRLGADKCAVAELLIKLYCAGLGPPQALACVSEIRQNDLTGWEASWREFPKSENLIK